MTSNSTPPLSGDHYFNALQDLESPVRDLAIMIEIAVAYIAEQPALPGLTFEQKRHANCAAFLVLKLSSMAEKLEETFDAAFLPRGGES